MLNELLRFPTKYLVCSYEPDTLSHHINAEHFFGFCLQVFRQSGPPQRADYLALMVNKRKVSFPRRQRRIASSRIRSQQRFDP